jgi:hypothetical protein
MSVGPLLLQVTVIPEYGRVPAAHEADHFRRAEFHEGPITACALRVYLPGEPDAHVKWLIGKWRVRVSRETPLRQDCQTLTH